MPLIRETTKVFGCDGPDCKETAPATDSTMRAPAGWIEGHLKFAEPIRKGQKTIVRMFHSLPCVHAFVDANFTNPPDPNSASSGAVPIQQ